MEPIRTLFTAAPDEGEAVLPEGLRARYGGDLSFPPATAGRPYVIANFVSTLDGVVTFDLPGQSTGAQISGSDDCDRFIMGLLRAASDAIVMGSGTLEASGPKALWLPESIYPAAADLFHQYRERVLQKPAHPIVVVVSGTGALDLDRALFHDKSERVVIVTSEKGKERLLLRGAAPIGSLNIRTLPDKHARLAPSAILSLLKEEFAAGLVLHEGGPMLLGEFLAAGLVDELFLTLAPQIAGRTPDHPRPGLVSSAEFIPSNAPWMKLLSAKKSENHLYLRYQV